MNVVQEQGGGNGATHKQAGLVVSHGGRTTVLAWRKGDGSVGTGVGNRFRCLSLLRSFVRQVSMSQNCKGA